MRTLYSLFVLLLLVNPVSTLASTPDLVVVISLDQFPYEYLTRFRPYFHGGLARLLTDGSVFTNATYKHAQCETGPGHAVLLSGSYADVNGIVTNNWYDEAQSRKIYCVQDDSARLAGSSGRGVSPRNLLQFTFGDMLRIHSGFVSKVISISNKDRAAILLGGKIPNGVFWMADSLFVSSTYYMAALPEWVQRFNATRLIDSYFGTVWRQSLPDSAFRELDRDDAGYEADHDSLGRTFPHIITGTDRTHRTSSYYDALLTSPYGVIPVLTMAKDAVIAERLGRRGVTDLLAVSISSTDYVGHAYGPHSHEVLEMAVAVDHMLGEFFAFLDSTVGMDHCLIALSSDHGVAPIPEYVKAHFPNVDAGRVSTKTIRASCEAAMVEAFGPAPDRSSWIEAFSDHNIYLRHELLRVRSIVPDNAAAVVVRTLVTLPGLAAAWNLDATTPQPENELDRYVWRSYRKGRSGDIVYILKPLYIEGEGYGTTHEDPYEYNTHVPLIMMGPGVRPGTYRDNVSPADLAPTLSEILGVEFPSRREGRVLWEALR